MNSRFCKDLLCGCSVLLIDSDCVNNNIQSN